MSKNKGKQHSNENTEKKHSSSAGQMTDDGRQMTDDRQQPAQARPGSSARDDGQQTAAGDGAPAAEAADQANKMAQLNDRLLRLQADFDNFRKRTLREKNELFDSANQALMLDLLPVLDHLQLGIQAASEHQADPAFREGLSLILNQLMGILSEFGLSPLETKKQVFDPNRFEAINALPSATEPEGTVLTSVRRGYMLRNKLLRPAQVIVSSGPPPEQNAECKTPNAE